MRTAVGAFRSKEHPMGRGLPQGGVLSPLLWLVFFNELPARLAAYRKEFPEIFGDVLFKDLIYADDITSVFACQNAHKLVEVARKNEEGISRELTRMLVSLSVPKSFNFVAPPGLISGMPMRRVPNSHKKTNLERSMLDQQNSSMLVDLTEEEMLDAKVSPPSL